MASLTSTFLDPRHLARTLGPTTIYFGKDVQGPVVRSFVIILDWLPTRMDDYIWIQIPKLSFEPKFKRGRTTGSKYQHKNIQSQNLGFKGSFIFGDQARAPNTTQRVFSLHWLLTVSKRPQIMDFRLLTTNMFGQAIVHDLWTKKTRTCNRYCHHIRILTLYCGKQKIKVWWACKNLWSNHEQFRNYYYYFQWMVACWCFSENGRFAESWMRIC